MNIDQFRFSSTRRVLRAALLVIAVLTPRAVRGETARDAIAPDELEMMSWPGDPEATAIVLADIGTVEFIGEFNLVYKRYRRVKILSKLAYDDWGTVAIPYYAKGGNQKVDSIEGRTTNLAADGTVKQVNLDPGSLFDEDVNRSVRRIRFTMPELQPGCIIEYRYTINSVGATFLNSWEFGSDQPTRYSEFVATIPDNLEYVMVKLGMLNFASEGSRQVAWPSRLSGFDAAMKHSVGQTQRTWTMVNVPAIRKEPFITTTTDYIPRLRFQLSRWSWPGSPGVDVIKDWDTIARDYEENLRSCAAAENVAKKIGRSLSDPRERMETILKHVRQTMTVDRTGGRSGADLCTAFKSRRGSPDDIATLLTTMLRKADLRAFPVLISTRANGKPVEIYPLTSQFNRVMTLVDIDGREYLLDASDPLRPVDLLPMEAMNGSGFVADPDDPRWTDIPAGKSGSATVVRARLSEDGTVVGLLESSTTGYAALEARHMLLEQSDEEYVSQTWSPRFRTGSIDSSWIANRDSVELPLVTFINFSDAATVDQSTHRIYVEPVFGKAAGQNPLGSARRILPVDFGCTTERAYTLTLDLPEAYALETVPADIRIDLPHDGGHLIRQVLASPGQVRFHRELVLARSSFDTRELKALRECYDRLQTLDSEQLVLVRNASAVDGGKP